MRRVRKILPDAAIIVRAFTHHPSTRADGADHPCNKPATPRRRPSLKARRRIRKHSLNSSA